MISLVQNDDAAGLGTNSRIVYTATEGGRYTRERAPRGEGGEGEAGGARPLHRVDLPARLCDEHRVRRLVRALAGVILSMLAMACCFGGLFDEPAVPVTPDPAPEPARAGEVRPIPSCSGPRCAIVHARALSADGTDAFVAVGDAIVWLRDDEVSHATVLAPTTSSVVAVAAASTHVLWIEGGVDGGQLLDRGNGRLSRQTVPVQVGGARRGRLPRGL